MDSLIPEPVSVHNLFTSAEKDLTFLSEKFSEEGIQVPSIEDRGI